MGSSKLGALHAWILGRDAVNDHHFGPTGFEVSELPLVARWRASSGPS